MNLSTYNTKSGRSRQRSFPARCLVIMRGGPRCPYPVRVGGLCHRHYMRYLRGSQQLSAPFKHRRRTQ